MLLNISDIDAEIILTAIMEKYKLETTKNEILRDKISTLESLLSKEVKKEND